MGGAPQAVCHVICNSKLINIHEPTLRHSRIENWGEEETPAAAAGLVHSPSLLCRWYGCYRLWYWFFCCANIKPVNKCTSKNILNLFFILIAVWMITLFFVSSERDGGRESRRGRGSGGQQRGEKMHACKNKPLLHVKISLSHLYKQRNLLHKYTLAQERERGNGWNCSTI